MVFRYLFLWFLAGVLASHPVEGQPARRWDPALSRELITLTRDTPMDQALRVIQTFSGRPIVDVQHLTEPIDVDIDRMPWPQALAQIANVNGLTLVEYTNYFELSPSAVSVTRDPPRSHVTLDSREVNISAIFFEADRSAIRELGIDWSTLSGGRVDVKAAHQGGSRVSNDVFSIAMRTHVGNAVSVDALLKTFESKNIGEVVANPQVKVQNGKSGYIQVGSDFSVTTSDYAGNAITQFFSTGTILTVKPQIITQDGIDFVDLDVEAERSSLVDPIRNLINKTVARTSTLLRDGEQTAIGGLYGQEVSESRTGVPLLKNLPGWFLGLGYVFGHNSKKVSKNELVVLLKVEIVPSVRQRTDSGATPDIIGQRRKAFRELMEGMHPKASSRDSSR